MHVALLRAVNLAGKKQVAMADLRTLAGDLGYQDVRTVLQSGNLIFRGPALATGRVETLLEGALSKKLGLETDFFVRTERDLESLIRANPFPDEAARDPGRLLVMFLKGSPTRDAVEALQAAIRGREVVRAVGRHLYVVYPDGVGRSKLTNSLIEKKLATCATGRNWNTVLRLAAAVAS
jgi:uncharacterized protein (DUF1697 family)